MGVLSGVKKIKDNSLAIVTGYNFGQAIPNIRKYGLATFLRNVLSELTRPPQAGELQGAEIKEPEEAEELPPISTVSEYVEWQNDYFKMKERINDARKQGIQNEIAPVSLIKVSDNEIEEKIRQLDLYKYDTPLVSIIIPVYNHVRFTVECLLSIERSTPDVAYEVIVVDDCSADDTGKLLPGVKNLRYIRNTENLGFGGTCNRGAEFAKGRFLVFLNNDVQVTPYWLGSLVRTFENTRNAGAVGPKVLYPDGRLQEAGALINKDCSATLIGHGDDPALPRYNYDREVDYCSGVCLLVEADRFRALKGFDPEFAPAYYEDVDLCFRLRYELGLKIMYSPGSVIVHHLSITSDSIENTYKVQCLNRNRQKLSLRWQEKIDSLSDVRLIAFYLPQFHPIPENDLWWGKGFTEWTNVAKAKPNFEGHYQPHIPADLGFYDLRAEEVMVEQAELAKRYGIYGFCFYYYWFHGKRMLETPIERMLKTNKPDIPFCLCWANENWTRRWDGRQDDILMEQHHSDADDKAVIMDVIRYMRHPNYIRIDGKPVFLLYRANLFPDVKRTVGIWREVCRQEGIGEIYLSMVGSFEHSDPAESPFKHGFDNLVEFPPHRMMVPCEAPGNLLNPDYAGSINDFREVVMKCARQQLPGYSRLRGVMTAWDNTARRQNNSHIFVNSSPGAYQAWLELAINQTREQNFGDERIVFINAWNEWAEGTHLEPDMKFGHGYLEATNNALDSTILRKQ